MKAEELQIFDWVSYKGNPIMVFEIDEPEHNINTEQDGYNAIRCISIDEIEPIPITHEILEKNGFAKNQVWNWWGHYADFPFIDFILREDNEGYYIDLMDARIKYLHQLQHAMRLCNVNKELVI